MPTTITKPTKAHARKILELLEHGLRSGGGPAEPGKMCVEQVVTHALGETYSDNPSCVAPAVRSFKIALNDSSWSSDKARAIGMKRIAIAQLGSNEIDQNVFVKELALATIRKIAPLALRAAAGMRGIPENHKPILEDHAKKLGAVADLNAASDAASDASYAARAASYAARAASYAAGAASYASDVASYAAGAARAASDAARAASDEALSLMAEIGVQALMKAGSPGCKWLDICK